MENMTTQEHVQKAPICAYLGVANSFIPAPLPLHTRLQMESRFKANSAFQGMLKHTGNNSHIEAYLSHLFLASVCQFLAGMGRV